MQCKALGRDGIRAFVVPKGTPGYIVTKAREDKLGLRCFETSALTFACPPSVPVLRTLVSLRLQRTAP